MNNLKKLKELVDEEFDKSGKKNLIKIKSPEKLKHFRQVHLTIIGKLQFMM